MRCGALPLQILLYQLRVLLVILCPPLGNAFCINLKSRNVFLTSCRPVGQEGIVARTKVMSLNPSYKSFRFNLFTEVRYQYIIQIPLDCNIKGEMVFR